MSEEMKAYQILAEDLENTLYKMKNAGVLSSLNKRDYGDIGFSKEKMLKEADEFLLDYVNEDGTELNAAQKEKIISFVDRDLFGYGVIDDLIRNPDISDIKLYGPEGLRVKTLGKRGSVGINFTDDKAYRTFVTRLLERNRVNLGTANAIQTFTDKTQENFILRLTAVSGLLTDTGETCLAIRKIPRNKYTLRDLEKENMFSLFRERKKIISSKKPFVPYLSKENEDLDRLFHEMIMSRGILFTGKGASGKTTLMNAFLSYIPEDESVMICQENSELFDEKHPDMLRTHVLINSGDSKVSYTLGDLTRAALLLDMDRVIVGEVKEGSEAAGLSKASMTGHKCWTSVHGESCDMAVMKMADYISQATGYTEDESLRQLLGFEYVVHLYDFHVDEIKKIVGFSAEDHNLIMKRVFPFERKGGQG